MFVACGIWCLADISSVSPSSEQMKLEIFSVPILKHQFDHLKKYMINYEDTFTCHSRNSQSRTYGYINIFSLGGHEKKKLEYYR